MDHYCEVCLKIIKAKNKYKHFKSKFHQEFDKGKHILFSYKDIDIDHVDEAFYLYVIEHNKKFDCYISKCEFKIVFNDYQYCPHVMFNVSDDIFYLSLFHFCIFIFNPHKISHKI